MASIVALFVLIALTPISALAEDTTSATDADGTSATAVTTDSTSDEESNTTDESGSKSTDESNAMTSDDEEKEEMEDLDDLDDELFEDDEEFDEEDGDTWEKVRNWVQDNLRVILSVLIVALIAVGIYNYSKKPVEDQVSQVDQIVGEEGEIAVVEEETEGEVEVKEPEAQEEEVAVIGDETEEVTEEVAEQEVTEQEIQEEETVSGKVYKVTAGSGDGVTHLARSALKEHLTAEPDSGLTKEHKIYIEDYMQKQIGSGRLETGEAREFSESLVKEAITKAKTLNESQLKNLEKYSMRVSDL